MADSPSLESLSIVEILIFSAYCVCIASYHLYLHHWDLSHTLVE